MAYPYVARGNIEKSLAVPRVAQAFGDQLQLMSGNQPTCRCDVVFSHAALCGRFAEGREHVAAAEQFDLIFLG